MDDLSPASRPAFMSKETAEAAPYVGADPDAVPQFDAELDGAAVPVGPDDPVVSVGKGPSVGYTERWRSIARLHALGQTNNQICRKLGYSAPGVSLALKQPFVQAEVLRYRQQYEADIMTQVRSAALDGVERIHRIILDDKERSSVVLDAAKWAVEKTTGKPKQEVSVESGTLTTFMEMLKDMRKRGEAIDVTPALGPDASGNPDQAQGFDTERNRYDTWIDDELR